MTINEKIRDFVDSFRGKYRIPVTAESIKPSQDVEVRLGTGAGFYHDMKKEEFMARARTDYNIEQARMSQANCAQLKKEIEKYLGR